MADTDPVEFILKNGDLLSDQHILVSIKDRYLYFQLNEPGSGKFNIPLDNPNAAYVDNTKYVEVWYRGILKGGFWVENVGSTVIDAQDASNRWKPVSGRGELAILGDAIVYDYLTPGNDTTRKFTGKAKGAILWTLLDEARNIRGCFPQLYWDFTLAHDSNGIPWADSEDIELTVGTYLLDVLRQFAKLGLDFTIGPDLAGNLWLGCHQSPIGTDKSATVIFHVGYNCTEVSDSSNTGSDLRNHMLVRFSDLLSPYMSVDDAPSQVIYRRRESLLQAANASTVATAAVYGQKELNSKKAPIRAIVIKVSDEVKPWALIDYDIGDTVGYDSNGTVVPYRIIGMQLNWPGESPYAEITLELNSTIVEHDIRVDMESTKQAGVSVGSPIQNQLMAVAGAGYNAGAAIAAHNIDAAAHFGSPQATALGDFQTADNGTPHVWRTTTLADTRTLLGIPAGGSPALVSPSVVGNFVSFSNLTGAQADSGKNSASFQAPGNYITALAGGDVTATGPGSVAATIANGAVTLAKMANMATASLIYRKTAGAGAPEVNTLATLKTDLGLMPPAAHNILDSTYHSDVLTGSILRGDILYGNATPKIARLAKGASGAVLTGDGTDTTWSAYTLGGTGALSLGITAGKTLTLTSTDTLNLTIPATGTAIEKSGVVTTGYIPFGVAGNLVGEDNGLFWDNANKWFGLGMAGVPLHPFDMISTETSYDQPRPVGASYLFRPTPALTVVGHVDYHGVDIQSSCGSNNVTATTDLYPLESKATYSGAATIGKLVGMYGCTINSGAGTTTYAINYRALHENLGLGTVSNVWGLSIEDPLNSGGGTITSVHGIHIAALAAGGSNFGIYDLSAFNHFSGDMEIDGKFYPSVDTTNSLGFYQANKTTQVMGINTTGKRVFICSGVPAFLPLNALHVWSTGTTATFQRDNAALAGLFEFYNADTTDANGSQLLFYGDTTGVGAAAHQVFGDFDYRLDTHDHATRAGTYLFRQYVAGTSTIVMSLYQGRAGFGTVTPATRVDIVGAVDIAQLQVTGYTTQNIGVGLVKFVRADTASGVAYMLSLTAKGSGSAGDGGGVLYNGASSTTSGRNMASDQWLWATATDASRKARRIFNVYDTAAREAFRIEASGSAPMIAFYGGTAVARGTALTAQLTTITCTAPGTPDYAIQDFTQTSPWGFASHDEANSVLKVIANLQTRCAELEARLGSATGVNLFA